MSTFPVGTSIHFPGNHASASGNGSIVAADARGYTIRLDDGREFRGIGPSAIGRRVGCGESFILGSAYQAWRNAAMAEIEAAASRFRARGYDKPVAS